MVAMDVLVAGSTMRHLVGHMATVDDAQFEIIKAMALSLGEVIVRPLAEALSVEDRGRARERMTTILIAFGPTGRRTVERLKGSANAAVRRTAIYLLREFGGASALPELTELLDDDEPQVQREAVRAILAIGTDQSYQVLERALATGSAKSREAIMLALGDVKDGSATPLVGYILRRMDHRGPLTAVYLRAIELMGGLRDSGGIPPLKEALRRGEWWAPRRTAALRAAAAAALARIGTPDAKAALEEAEVAGSRGVRAAVRPHLRTGRAFTRTGGA
jgi:HEAT repeat protein